jgi:hypothetical protein
VSDPQGLITYPGLSTFTKAEYALSQGISPGKCTIELPQELVGDLAPTGDLTIRYGDQTITLPTCLLDDGHTDQSGGYIARVTILDRRWQWKFGAISGHYNLRMPGGANAAEGFNGQAAQYGQKTNIRPGTEIAPQDIATLCLQAMGEQSYEVSALPNAARPEVDWSWQNPAEALQQLCEGLGCRVTYVIDSDSVVIVTVGQGNPLPDNRLQTFNSAGINPPNTPSAIMLVGGPWVYQGFLRLTAVGIDTDGSIRTLDKLTYTPVNGWEAEDPNVFPSFNNQPDVRPLVEKSVYKMWRVDGPVQVPSNDIPDFNDVRQLKLYDRLVDTNFDSSDRTRTVPKKPEIWGSFDPKYAQTLETPTSTHATYKDGITVDADRWLIITEEPLYAVNNSEEYAPANIQIKIAYSVRDPSTWEFSRYTQDLQLNSATPTQPRIIRHDDIFGKAVGNFDDTFNLIDYTDNIDTDGLEQEASYHLQAAAQEYIQQDSFDVPYAGLVPIQIDGLIQQVTYSISSGPGGSTMTRASLATEHNPYVLPWSARRRNEKERSAPPSKIQDGRSALDTRTGGF